MGTTPDDLTVFESSDADFMNAHCTGEMKALETLDRTGSSRAAIALHPRELVGSVRGAYWEHAQARLHVSESQSMAVLELVFGPRYGRGCCFTRVQEGSITQSNVWIS